MWEVIKAVIKKGSFPSDAELIAVVPGYKGKGEGGPGNRLNYRFFGLSCSLGRIVRRWMAARLIKFLIRLHFNLINNGKNC